MIVAVDTSGGLVQGTTMAGEGTTGHADLTPTSVSLFVVGGIVSHLRQRNDPLYGSLSSGCGINFAQRT